VPAARPAPAHGIADPARAASRQDDLIKEAAWLYYHDELNQSDIAERMQLSRASVVNYLAEARDRGWVKLYLDSDVFLGHSLAADLCKAYGLTEALVVPDAPDAAELSESRVVRAAADWLPRLLEPGDRLGVSWGETVFRLAQAVPRQIIPDVTVVQLLGSRPAALGFAAETCTTILSQQLGAHCVNLHVPLLLSDKDLAERLRAEPVVAQQLAAVASCNKTVLACGTCDPDAHIVRTGLLDAKDMARFREKGATGVICARLIDATGQAVPAEIEDRMIGVTLDQMRGKDMSLLVAAGKDRARSARAAILGGFATHLATSASVARILLEERPT
jgi:deoxyribonucleoside regulator